MRYNRQTQPGPAEPLGHLMNRNTIGGLLGLIVGGVWLANNYRYFDEQGFVAIGMPLILMVAGVVYLVLGINKRGNSS